MNWNISTLKNQDLSGQYVFFCETFGNLGLFLQQKKVKSCRSGESFGDKEWPTA